MSTESNKSLSVKNPLASLLQLSPAATKLGALAVAGLFTLGLLALFRPTLLSLEEQIGTLGWTMSPDQSTEERITLVVIDEQSIAEVGPWPWARSDIARLITAIDNAGAQLQLHDIVYPEARIGDDLVLGAIADSSGVIFAQTPALGNESVASNTGLMTHSFNGVACDSVNGGLRLTAATSYVAPAAGFASVPKGHIGALIDADGAVRRSPALVCNDGQAYPSLAISAFLQLGSASQWGGQIEAGSSWFGPTAMLTLDGYPGLDIPLDSDGTMRISFAKAPESFRALSAADVMNGRIDTAMLENAWVLVGGTAFGMGDIVPTPYSGAVQGIELQARLLASLLDVNVPYTPAASGSLLVLLSVLFALALYGLATTGERMAAYGLPVAALVLPLLALSVHNSLLANSNVWLGWIAPSLFGICGASALLLLELARTRMERARVFGNLNSYLPQEVARKIAFSLPTSNVNAERRNVTLLNADLRNFSAFGEARPPEEIAAVLHYFFTRATEIIESHGGRVHEFKGDSLLAMWSGADDDSAIAALHSAQEMQDALNDTLLPEQALAGLEPLALGIGIEQGPVLIGSIGPAHRRSHTLLGDTVGITLRIQEMTAELAQPILVGECAARQLNDEKLESQGSYLLSGLRIPHTLFAPRIPATVIPISSSTSAQPNLTVVGGGKS